MQRPVFILAGEPSGDQLAAHIMRSVDDKFGRQAWFGVGGQQMADVGLESLAEMDDLTVFGFGSALSAYPRLLKLADRLVEEVMRARPRLVITVDVKGFSLRFAMRLRRRMAIEGWSAPIVHCVAPTVWAWGQWRAKKFAGVVDRLLCLFPYEPAYFTPYGIDAAFIGHPEAFNPRVETDRTKISRAPHKTVLLFPGSRRSEIDLILPPMLGAIARLRSAGSTVRAYILSVPRLSRRIESIVANQDAEIIINDGDISGHMAKADAMIAASGTVTLQAALQALPGVTCYRTGLFSALVGRCLVDLDKVVLPNAILGRQVYPFMFQNAATEAKLAKSLQMILNDSDAKNTAKAAAEELRQHLTGGKNTFANLVTPALEAWFQRS